MLKNIAHSKKKVKEILPVSIFGEQEKAVPIQMTSKIHEEDKIYMLLR